MSAAAARRALFRPVDVAALVWFRVAFGLLMLWEVERYVRYGWIAQYWIEPAYHFPYEFFGWVRPWPPWGMYLHFGLLGVLAFCITIGLLYRLSAALFFVAFSYVFLLDQARYLNHHYLVALLAFLLILVPAHCAGSVDSWRRPGLARRTAPAWTVVLLAGQMGLVYFFGGVAKLNADWLGGAPLGGWLARGADVSFVGAWLTERWLVYLAAYAALAIDLLAAPLLLWPRSRPAAFAFIVIFHYANDRTFSIGIFPWLSIAATTLFFRSDWPRQVVRVLSSQPNRRGALAWAGALTMAAVPLLYRDGVELVPLLIGGSAGALLGYAVGSQVWPEDDRSRTASAALAARLGLAPSVERRSRWTVPFVCVWFALQAAVPLRHFAIPGNVSWTEEGHRFSWHMKLRSKTGRARFDVTDRGDGTRWIVDPRTILTDWQYAEMSARPHMIRQFARDLGRRLSGERRSRIEVRALAEASLNGREWQPLIDPAVDLAREPFRFEGARWIVPLHSPMPAPRARSGVAAAPP